MFRTALKKGSMELIVLHTLTEGPRHGYEIGRLIELRSQGRLTYRISSFYPVLCRMEKRGWISGRWVEKEGERRRRFYRLTPRGEQVLAEQKAYWAEFSGAIDRILGVAHA
jgi:PadR family transcriptional regulator PadR